MKTEEAVTSVTVPEVCVCCSRIWVILVRRVIWEQVYYPVDESAN